LFIGVVWPSIWLSFNSGPQIAAAAPAAAQEALEDDATTQALADRVAATGKLQSVERLYTLLALPRLDDAQARELAALAAPAFGTVTDDETGTSRSTSVDELLAMLRAMQQAEAGTAAPPRSIDQWGEAAPVSADLQTAGFADFLDPRNALRLFSVYQMKDRAGVVGAHGIATLLRDVIAAAGGTRVHAVGHSYGCKVILSAVCAPPPLPRSLDSLLLLQPAVSHLCFADLIPRVGKPGGYRNALERVRTPILSTYSDDDFALHKTFHLALRRDSDLGEQDIGIAADIYTTAGTPPSNYAALGGFGPRRAGQRLVDPIPAAGTPYPAFDAADAVIGLDGSQGLIGSHGDITSPTTAWALHQLLSR
jgi:pimeloyl-ACP methyl ester carboxylesterase